MKNNNRRNFLKKTAIVGSSVFASPIFSIANDENKYAKNNMDINKISKFRVLGSGNYQIKVSAIGLGCMGMSFHRSFIPNKKEMIQLINNAYNVGINFFDTAEVYGPFTNEELVGEAIASFRKKIILCSKFGFEIQNNKITYNLNSHPKHIREVVEQSLKRLNTDYIDLLYQHRVDPKIPIEDVAGTVKDLITEGKVKYFGLSEAGIEDIKKAHSVQPITALQSEFSLMTREPLQSVIPLCEQLGIGFVPYSPLSRAYLTGYINERTKYDATNDNRPTLPRYTPEAIVANWTIIDLLAAFGNARGLTVAQVALAWLQAQKPFIVPIPGTTKLAHLQENIGSTNVEFTPDELNNLTNLISTINIVGERNPVKKAN